MNREILEQFRLWVRSEIEGVDEDGAFEHLCTMIDNYQKYGTTTPNLNFTIQDVKYLRERTGCSLLTARQALWQTASVLDAEYKIRGIE